MPPWPAPRRSAILCLRLLGVLGQLVRERCELARHRPADATEDDKRQHHDQDHRRRASEPEALEHADDRVQQEGQQDGQRHRDQHHASPIQTRNDQDETGKGIKQWRLAYHSGHDYFLIFIFAYLRYAMGQRTVPRRTRLTIASRMTAPSNEMSSAGRLKLL